MLFSIAHTHLIISLIGKYGIISQSRLGGLMVDLGLDLLLLFKTGTKDQQQNISHFHWIVIRFINNNLNRLFLYRICKLQYI